MSMLINATLNQTMSSREIAELTGKQHDNVLKLVRSLIEAGIVKNTTPQQYVHPQNKQTYTEYLSDKRDSLVVVARLSPEFTAAVVDRWQELEAAQFKAPAQLTTLEILQMAMQAEQGRLQAIAERDHAIATKHLIGSKREATAMANTATANRKLKALENQLDQARDYASVKKVESITKRKFEWKPLKHWSVKHGVEIKKAFDANYEKGVNTYSSSAWLAVYGVDIYALECAK